MQIKKVVISIIRFFFYDLILIKTNLLSRCDKFYVLIILRIKYILRLKNNTTKLFGKKWKADSLYNLLAIEAYIYQIETIRKIIKPSLCKTIFDVGAHIGTYSMLLNRAYPDAKIFCFEPNPITFHILKSNLAGVNNVIIYNIGFSNENSRLKIYYKEKALDAATFEVKRAQEERSKNLIECSVKTLSGFVDDLNIKKIDILKIDVEGHEKKILSVAENALKITRYLIIEISLNLDFSFSEIIRLLRSDFYNFTLLKVIKIWENGDGTIAIIELLFKNEFFQHD